MILIYVARRLKEAQSIEAVLDAGGLDYAVEPAPYGGRTLFGSPRVGAFFYVLPQSLDDARTLILQNGYIPYAKE